MESVKKQAYNSLYEIDNGVFQGKINSLLFQ